MNIVSLVSMKKKITDFFSFANIAGVAGRIKNTCRVDESRGYKNILRDFKVFFSHRIVHNDAYLIIVRF